MRSKRIKKFFLYLFRIFPIKQNKIVASNFRGKGFGGETGKIINCLLKNNKKLNIVWLTKEKIDYCGIRSVYPETLLSLYHLATAKIWLDNARKSSYVIKRNKQYYIQTWHGEACIKYVEADAEASLDKLYVKEAKNDSKLVDVMVSGSEWRTKNYREAFWYDGEILHANLYGKIIKDDYTKQKILAQYKVNKNNKILLYAPTFRNGDAIDFFGADFNELVKRLQLNSGEEWTIFIRLHPSLKEEKIHGLNDKVINVSNYPFFNDLLAVADYVISDYSGIIIDCFKNYIPLFLYCPDYDDYIKKNRDLYFDITKLPSTVSYTFDDLINNIMGFEREHYQEKCFVFNNNFGYYENDGIEIVANRILEYTKND